MYNLIYDYIINNLLDNIYLQSLSTTILGQTITLDMWLAHTLTITFIVVICIVLALFVKWLFKLFSGLILLR